ncbi:unnamed protein product [Lampetra fluviatilis]
MSRKKVRSTDLGVREARCHNLNREESSICRRLHAMRSSLKMPSSGVCTSPEGPKTAAATISGAVCSGGPHRDEPATHLHELGGSGRPEGWSTHREY